jgi:tetratricopeptide (TPR) repeat protein
MKTRILMFTLVICLQLAGLSQNTAFDSVMVQSVKQLGSVATPEVYLEHAAHFERIAASITDNWLPLYYAAYCYTNYAFLVQEGDKKDQRLDQAQANIEKALKLSPNESELHVLQAMIYQARISVNPMARGMKYSQKANEELGEAEKLNPENPRTYFLRGQNIFGTPKMFGGGKEAAKPQFIKAKEKFAAQLPANPLMPSWGKEANDGMVKACE